MEPLKRLLESATALNAESDGLARRLREIEDAVNAAGLGLEVQHDGWAFGKSGQRWRFYRAEDRRPVTECPRTQRLEFAAVVGALIQKLDEAARNQTEQVARANEALDEQLKRLKSVRPTRRELR